MKLRTLCLRGLGVNLTDGTVNPRRLMWTIIWVGIGAIVLIRWRTGADPIVLMFVLLLVSVSACLILRWKFASETPS